MNDFFSFKRFGLLVKKFTKEHLHTYLLLGASLFGILLVTCGITVLNMLHWEYQPDAILTIFIGSLMLSICIFNAAFYGFFQHKAKGIQFLHIPASQAEKLALGFLFTQIIFLVTFLVLFSVTDNIMCYWYNHFHKFPEHVLPEELPEYVAHPVNFFSETAKGTIIFSLMLAAVSHFGSLCFEKNAFVKTTICILLIGGAIFYYNFYSMQAMIPEKNMPGGKFFNQGIRLDAGNDLPGFVSLPSSWYYFMYWFIPGFAYVSFWMASYYKLKEKQV